MKFAQTLESYGITLGMKRPDGSGLFNRRNVAVLIIYIFYFLLSTTYLVFTANTLREYAMCFFVWFTLLDMIIGFMSMMVTTPILFGLLDSFNELITNEIHDPVARHLFEINNERIEFWSRVTYTFFIKFIIPLGFIGANATSLFLYYAMDMGSDAFILLECLWFPWETTNPIGYLASVPFFLVLFILIFYSIICALGMMLAIFVLMNATIHFIIIKCYVATERFKVDRNKKQFIDGYYDMTRFAMRSIELASMFMDANKYIVALFYCWSMLSMCDTLLLFYVAEDPKDLFIPGLFSFFAFTLIFMFCEVGERFIAGFENTFIEIWMSDWYTFPLEIQKLIPFFTILTQNPIMIQGVGNIQCTREDFKNVTTKGCSYFAMFKEVLEAR